MALIGVQGAVFADPPVVEQWDVLTTSLVSRDDPPLQRIDLSIVTSEARENGILKVWSEGKLLGEKPLGALKVGTNEISVLLPEPKETAETRWVLSDGGSVWTEKTLTWRPPRHWTLYVVKSAHIDIGLHEPQYKQRFMAAGFIDQAKTLAGRTSDWPDASRYRYVVEGLWWWLNYPQDRSDQLADEIVEKYVKTGLFDIAASHSGNRTEVYGREQLCRSAYCIQETRERWGLPMETMLMVDNNGITWPLVTAYADAGVKYLGFFPNDWNPGTVGGSRIDVSWQSPLPLLFYWQGPDRASRILVWASPHYWYPGPAFGIRTHSDRAKQTALLESAAPQMARQLALLEARYPYDVWLVPNYADNEAPSLSFPEMAKAWNARWRWPELRTVGDLSEPFRETERRFGDKIPTLSGTMTAGWAQHPPSTPTLLAMKLEADRLLPTAEKLATLARLTDPAYAYPAKGFRRAWDALVCNDEHGYGTSAYRGRSVYDTWMQKRDWIERALATAENESGRALKTLAAQVSADGPSVFVFNPTLQPRSETVRVELPPSCAALRSLLRPGGAAVPAVSDGNTLIFRVEEIPPLGYALFRLVPGDAAAPAKRMSDAPPAVENAFYRVTFGADGAIAGLFDKTLERELLDPSAPYRCNQFVYTRDANKTFTSPSAAKFEIETSALGQTVVARMDDPASGAALEQRVTLPAFEKRIEIDNRLAHVRGLAETNRWYQFGYYAFPFNVPDGRFRVGLNGCDADPFKDQTGHGTDTYHAPRDWSHVGNGAFGVALAQLDSVLIECGEIHEKKNTFGKRPETSHLYSYVFNNWLYGHAWAIGPSHMNLRYRYAITSHAGNFREAGVARFAERAVTPLLASVIPQARKGKLPAETHSFLAADAPNIALLALKLSEAPGRGVIARFQETDGVAAEAVAIKTGWGGGGLRLTRCSVTEQDRGVLERPALAFAPFGYATLRIEEPGVALSASAGDAPAAGKDAPAKVGSFYTGLIDAPRAWRGDAPDMLYLQWGQNRESDLSHYELYRGDTSDFALDQTHFLAKVEPGLYVAVPYEDTGLKPHTAYYYRVVAVDRGGRRGEPSDVCKGVTREPLAER
jgi:hypothetical protein